MIIDGKQIASGLLQELVLVRKSFSRLRLGVLMSEGDKTVASFVRIKKAVAATLEVEVICQEIHTNETTAEVIARLEALLPSVDGVVVQLPLPTHIDLDSVLQALPPQFDVDGIGTKGKSLVLSPVPAAMQEILTRSHISLSGKNIVLAGLGRLVGAPTAQWLQNHSIAPVIVTTSEDLIREAPTADIVILGTGTPGLLTPALIQEGVIVLDAGTSETEGRVVGDADPACAIKASLFTPVPGGIGPIAVAMLFKNLLTLAQKKLLPSS